MAQWDGSLAADLAQAISPTGRGFYVCSFGDLIWNETSWNLIWNHPLPNTYPGILWTLLRTSTTPLEPEAWNPKTPDLVGRLGIGRVWNGKFDYVVFQQGFENAWNRGDLMTMSLWDDACTDVKDPRESFLPHNECSGMHWRVSVRPNSKDMCASATRLIFVVTPQLVQESEWWNVPELTLQFAVSLR